MPKLSTKLKKAQEEHEKPLWEGPCSNTPNGGITQSMLNLFIVCPERFRVKYILGLHPPDQFYKTIEYGNMWHACEESLAAGDKDIFAKLDLYTVELCRRYPMQQEEVIHWHNVCKLQFPLYVEWWEEHSDVLDRIPLIQEGTFRVPYKVSGSTVILRGKWDSVDVINGKVWLQENKTKGEIDELLMQRNLNFDLQTMLYLTALEIHTDDRIEDEEEGYYPLGGVRYNVIRRPLSGGKGSIRQKKNQTLEAYYEELAGIIRGACGSDWGLPSDEHHFFKRWNVEISAEDVARFEQQFLAPKLRELVDWYDEQMYLMEKGKSPFEGKLHWRAPYGIYSQLYDGKPTELDNFLDSGSRVGLRRADKLFRELDS